MKANSAGQAVEDVLAAVLKVFQIDADRQVVIGRSLLGGKLRVDFLARNLVDFPDGLVIESKWQDQRGSTDEKLWYLVENIQRCYALPTIVIAHGGGARPGAVQYLRDHVGGNLVAVYALEEFISWALRAPKRVLEGVTA